MLKEWASHGFITMMLMSFEKLFTTARRRKEMKCAKRVHNFTKHIPHTQLTVGRRCLLSYKYDSSWECCGRYEFIFKHGK